MIVFSLLAMGWIGAVLQITASRQRGTRAFMAEVFLRWTFGTMVGVAFCLSAFAHVFMAAPIARSIGWSPGSPFQFEVAMADLSYGVLGLIAVRWRGGFRWATAIAYSVFCWGAAFGHIRDLILRGNHALNNTGMTLAMDLLAPLILFGLLVWERSVRGLDKSAVERYEAEEKAAELNEDRALVFRDRVVPHLGNGHLARAHHPQSDERRRSR